MFLSVFDIGKIKTQTIMQFRFRNQILMLWHPITQLNFNQFVSLCLVESS